jgi:hypothetical protein
MHGWDNWFNKLNNCLRMIKANELRIGNLLTWNPKLLSPNNTLPPTQVEVSAILPDRIMYVFPNIENRVEPFEDDVAQAGTSYKSLNELEPIILTVEILQRLGFEEKSGLLTSKHFEKGGLELKFNGEYFERVSISTSQTKVSGFPVRYFHQLQNLYFAWTGEELEIKLHGQQS